MVPSAVSALQTQQIPNEYTPQVLSSRSQHGFLLLCEFFDAPLHGLHFSPVPNIWILLLPSLLLFFMPNRDFGTPTPPRGEGGRFFKSSAIVTARAQVSKRWEEEATKEKWALDALLWRSGQLRQLVRQSAPISCSGDNRAAAPQTALSASHNKHNFESTS